MNTVDSDVAADVVVVFVADIVVVVVAGIVVVFVDIVAVDYPIEKPHHGRLWTAD